MKKWQSIVTTSALAAALLAGTAGIARSATPAGGAGGGAAAGGGAGGGGEGGRSTIGGSGPLKDELDPATRAAVDKGLAWLAKNVTDKGTVNGEGGDSAANMALAGLAFLADGSM